MNTMKSLLRVTWIWHIWHIWDSIRHNRETVTWHKAVWHRLSIPRYAHHLWLICHGRIYTLHRLASLGLEVIDCCHLCVGGRESLDHLFLFCTYSNQVVAHLGTLLGLPYHAFSWQELLHSWLNTQDSTLRHLALLSLQVATYHLWRERNCRVHNKGILFPSKLLTEILVDIKTRLSSSSWFIKRACNSSLSSWLAI